MIAAAPSAERTGVSLEQFLAETNDRALELINGEWRAKVPTNALHNEILHRLFFAVVAFVERLSLGLARMEATFILPERDAPDWVRGSRTPDFLFYTAERIRQYKAAHPDWQGKPYAIVPDLVVEVVSPNDSADQVTGKVDLYLADGVREVWVVYPAAGTIMIYAPDSETVRLLRRDSMLGDSDVLPGFQLSLHDLFSEVTVS
jgi:Uma2 family endonuclease